jgi:hypothetical protein
MDLKPLSPELNELRSVVISSNLASCYLVLELLKSEKNETLNYEKFRDQWIDIYKSTYGIVSKMKPRKSSRSKFSRKGGCGESRDGDEGKTEMEAKRGNS